MTQQIKVLRENIIKALPNTKEDNVSIADVVINRNKLLQALKLQTQTDADILTLTYGKVSFQDRYKTQGYGSYWKDVIVDNEPCVQLNCNHTIMRFLNRPKAKYGQEPKVISLNFVDYRSNTPLKPELDGTRLDTQALLEALTFVQHGVATEESRPVLCCVLFDSTEEGLLKLVSADGYRLPLAQIPANGLPSNKVLIHSKDIVRLIAWLKTNIEGKGKYKYWLDTYIKYTEGTNPNKEDKNGTVKFSSEKGTLEFENRIGTYPDYPQLIPQSGTHIQVVASEMLESVKALNTIAKDGSGIIRLVFSKYPDKLTLSANSEDLGNSTVECQARVDKPCNIAVNAKYLIGYLTSCKNNIIDLFVRGATYPMTCYNRQEQLEVIMPMFVQWEA